MDKNINQGKYEYVVLVVRKGHMMHIYKEEKFLNSKLEKDESMLYFSNDFRKVKELWIK